eukprot:1913829-Amphidinium_carterae.2
MWYGNGSREPFHDTHFANGVEWRWRMSAEECEKCSRTITSNSRRTRGPRDGWISPNDLPPYLRDQRLILLACCFGKKPRIELTITSTVSPRGGDELDIIILKMRAIQGYFTPNKGEDSMNLETVAALYHPISVNLPGRYGFHTTPAHIGSFRKTGIIAGGAPDNYGWNWDITREFVHMTPVSPMHAQAWGIWKSEGHGWRRANSTLVIDLLMFTEECQAKVCQARTGIFLTRETIPWFCICGWYESASLRRFQVNMDYGYFSITHSRPEKAAGEERGTTCASHRGSETKKEDPSAPKEVPRADAGAEDDTTAEPPQWKARDGFAGFSGVVGEKGIVSGDESENLARRLKDFMMRQGKIRPEDEEDEDDKDEDHVGEAGNDMQDQAGGDRGEPKPKVPKTENTKKDAGYQLGERFVWDEEPPPTSFIPKVLDKRGLKV